MKIIKDFSMGEITKYNFTDEDLKLVTKFVKDFHFEESKSQRGRTNAGKRDFGGEMDSFIPGKLVEIAVCKILSRASKTLELSPDFKIYPNHSPEVKDGPDVTNVIDIKKSIDRPPRLFIEIKRFDPDEKWEGARAGQLKDMTEGYMIHAFIGFEDNLSEKSHDIVASVLKKIISSDDIIDLSEFSEFSNLYAEIKHIYTFSNLLEKGHLFEQGEIIPKTNFGTSHPAYSKKGEMRKGYKLVKAYQNVSKQVLCMKYKATEKFSFSNWKVSGTFDIVKNSKNFEYIYARKNTKMFNKAFGQYVLEDNKTYIFHYTNAMEGDTRKRNDDWWFSKLRFEQLLASKEFKDQESLISEIVENI